MALPTGGYTFTPQTANLGASPLSALKPLDVGVSVSFTPMPKYEVPSAGSELVSVGMAQGLQGFSEPIISAYKALDDEAKKKEDDALKYLRDVNLAKIKAEKTPEELEYDAARLANLRSLTKDRGGDKVPVKTRAAGSISPDIVRSSDSYPLPEDTSSSVPTERKIDFNEESLVPPPKDEELPPYKPVGALFDISYQPRVATRPEPVISDEQIAAVTNPPFANMQVATGGVMVPPAPIPEATPTPTPEVRAATPSTTQPTSFKATPDQLAKIEENRLKMIEEMISKAPQDQQVQQPAQQNVDDTIGELTDFAYESAADARKAVSKIKKLLPSYKEAKITPQYDETLGKRVFFVEQPEADDKYVAPGSTPKLNKEQVQMVLSMQDNLRQDPLYSKALTFRDSKDTILASLEKQDGFSDIAAINAFQRLIDPGVAVREGDVALIQSAISFFSKYDPKFITESFSKGSKLPPADREKMRKLTMELTRMGLEKANKEIIPRFTQMASDAGLNPDYVIKPFDIPLDKTQLTKEIDVLEARMRGIPKSQSNDPAAIEMINKRNSLKKQLQQAK